MKRGFKLATATVYGNAKEHTPSERLDRTILASTTRHPVDLIGFDAVSVIIPAGNTVLDLIDDSTRIMANAIEILRFASAEAEQRDPRLSRILAGAATLFMQAGSLQEAIYETISVGDAIPIKPASAVGAPGLLAGQ